VKASVQQSTNLNPEMYALRVEDRIEAIRYLAHGGVFFHEDEEPHQLGLAVRNMRDPRVNRGHLPHPLLQAITSYNAWDISSSEAVFSNNGCWLPGKYVWQGSKLDQSPLSAPEMAVLRSALARDFPDLKDAANSAALSVLYPKSFVDQTGPRRRRVSRNHDVKVAFEGRIEYCRIAKPIVVKFQDKSLPYFFPQWFQRVPDCKQGELLGVEVVEAMAINASSYNLPQPVTAILEQVMLVHICKRKCGVAGHDSATCSCLTVCGVRHVCPDHLDAKCKHEACKARDRSHWQQRDWHQPRGKFFVFDHAHGFVPDAPLQRG